MKRRDFLKIAGGTLVLAAGATAIGGLGFSFFSGKKKKEEVSQVVSSKAKVYFTDDISAESLLKLYEKINKNIKGKVAIKIHTGEPNGPNIIPRDMVMALQKSIPNSALAETNVLYPGSRHTTAEHRKTLKINGWDFCNVDILDEDGAIMIPIKNGHHFKEMSVGKNLINYDSMVVLTHFKGHSMGGFGGSMKNIAIGCADGKIGKAMQHNSPGKNWDITGKNFMENMSDAAKAVTDFFGNQIVYINVLRNMSVDCDCTGTKAAPVKARNIGILASTDILAVDKASIDLLYQLPEEELHDLQERIESREGLHQLTSMENLGMGNSNYDLIKV